VSEGVTLRLTRQLRLSGGRVARCKRGWRDGSPARLRRRRATTRIPVPTPFPDVMPASRAQAQQAEPSEYAGEPSGEDGR
jgi:hypothetical protein